MGELTHAEQLFSSHRHGSYYYLRKSEAERRKRSSLKHADTIREFYFIINLFWSIAQKSKVESHSK